MWNVSGDERGVISAWDDCNRETNVSLAFWMSQHLIERHRESGYLRKSIELAADRKYGERVVNLWVLVLESHEFAKEDESFVACAVLRKIVLSYEGTKRVTNNKDIA
mgnify:CR=1 FL=1